VHELPPPRDRDKAAAFAIAVQNITAISALLLAKQRDGRKSLDRKNLSFGIFTLIRYVSSPARIICEFFSRRVHRASTCRLTGQPVRTVNVEGRSLALAAALNTVEIPAIFGAARNALEMNKDAKKGTAERQEGMQGEKRNFVGRHFVRVTQELFWDRADSSNRLEGFAVVSLSIASEIFECSNLSSAQKLLRPFRGSLARRARFH